MQIHKLKPHLSRSLVSTNLLQNNCMLHSVEIQNCTELYTNSPYVYNFIECI